MKKQLLVIEQDETIRRLYTKVFGQDDYEIYSVESIDKGLDVLKSDMDVNGIILDFALMERTNTQFIPSIKTKRSNLFILLTGGVSTEKLMECIKLGVDDFIEKPFLDLELLKNSVENLFEKLRIQSEDTYQKETEQLPAGTKRLIGQSKSILELKKLIHKVAPLDSTVLVLGETGTGKEVVARMIHSLSPQRHNNFMAVHCGGIPDTLLESTLFGHEKGSFTGAYRTHKGYFEFANDGTIFLDEIGDTTQSFQVKLLRVLQDKQFRRVGGTESLTTSARVIAATNRNLVKAVERGEFREDLYYRLHVITMKVPPLRERNEDIALLIRYFMHVYTRKYNRLGVYLKPETIQILEKQAWKGNVRELENVVERLVALSDTDWIGPSELPDEYLQVEHFNFIENGPFLPYSEAKNMFEKEYITMLLKKADGNVSKAAKMAGMPRQNLHLKIKKHKLGSKQPVD